MTLLIFKFIFLTLAVMYTFTCVARVLRNQCVHPPQIFLMGLGVAGFTVLQFLN